MEKVVSFKLYIRLIAIIALLFSFTKTSAQQTPLNKSISLNVSNITIQNALILIGEKGNFNFSYNSSIIDNDKIVSINAKNSSVEAVLNEILDKNIKYEVVGNHVVLLGKNRIKNKETKDIEYIISGYIIDSSTGKIIRSATIYDIDGKTTSITDSIGYYSISIPANKEFRGLTYCKRGYLDTVIIIRPSEIKKIDMPLRPKAKSIEKMPAKEIAPIPNQFDNQIIVNWVVPPEALSHSNNLVLYEKRIGQVSFLPFPGTHTSVNGATVNYASLNVIAGFSDGVEGMEIGGVLNIDRSYVKGFQVAGFGNIVGKKTNGVQIAGFFNINTGSISGVQIAGFNNVVNDTITGVQIAGFTNLLRGKMNGVQIAGFYNHTTKDVEGVQIAGFANTTKQDVVLLQIGGFYNYCKNVKGFQIAGFANFTNDIKRGFQIAGFLNYARKVEACQIGFLNICDTTTGISIGFLNHIKKGYRSVDLSGNEIFSANISYRSGIKKFYNIYNFGVDPSDTKRWNVGIGIGTISKLNKTFALHTELLSTAVNETKLWEDELNLLNRLSSSIELKIMKRFSLISGPALNFHVSAVTDTETGLFTSAIAENAFYEWNFGKNRAQLWLGFNIALRFIVSKNT
ncbi:MAG: STN and carboxypeptidase regulatory-like domain-containing protein [Bacteroidota bacterium]